MADDRWRALLPVLRCPVCGGSFTGADGRALSCAGRHSFDIARHGYVGLLGGGRRAATGDSAAMVQAREDFLRAGHYAPLAGALARAVADAAPPGGTVLDAGVGTGYYLAAALDAVPDGAGLGLDTSAYALRRAGRAHPRAGAASWDVWRPLPVRDGACDVVLNVFAPRNGPEFHRVLRPGGALVVATPGPGHLDELRRRVGLISVDGAKEERLRRALSGRFDRVGGRALEYVVTPGARDVGNLAAMGPTARHVPPEELRRRIAALDGPLAVTVSFTVSVYRPRAGA
ncbi:rRNA (guanine-N1)-methyltransferase [Streptomyces capparidis]